jgi:hypothetical protein
MSVSSNVGNPVYVLGQEYILEFGQLLAENIEIFLEKQWGSDWFDQCVSDGSQIGKTSMRDLSFLMRQILDLNNHNFRLAIAMTFFGTTKMEKPHLTALEQIRKLRNLWAHPDRTIEMKDLSRLSFNIIAVVPSTMTLAKKCSKSLAVSENEGHLSQIASMTSISKLYQNSVEYKSEMAIALREFTSQIKANSDNSDLSQNFVAQNHLLNNLYLNFQVTQALYHSLMMDSLIDIRDKRNGRKLLNDKALEELFRDLDTNSALNLAAEFSDSLSGEIGREVCSCAFCENVPLSEGFSMREPGQTKVADVYLNLHTNKPIQNLFEDFDPSGGRMPGVFLFIMAVCLNKSGISAEEIYNEWSFDVLNPLIDLDSDVYDIEGLTSAAIRLVAIRNGIAPEVVQSWELE